MSTEIDQMRAEIVSLRAQAQVKAEQGKNLLDKAVALRDQAQKIEDKILDLEPPDFDHDDTVFAQNGPLHGMKAYRMVRDWAATQFHTTDPDHPVLFSGQYAGTALPIPQVLLTYQKVPEHLEDDLVAYLTRAARIVSGDMGDGFLLVNILEHTLSERVSYMLEINPHTRQGRALSQGIFGRREFEGTLTQTLEYAAEHLWYDGGPGEED